MCWRAFFSHIQATISKQRRQKRQLKPLPVLYRFTDIKTFSCCWQRTIAAPTNKEEGHVFLDHKNISWKIAALVFDLIRYSLERLPSIPPRVDYSLSVFTRQIQGKSDWPKSQLIGEIFPGRKITGQNLELVLR